MKMPEILLESTLTCPNCGYVKIERMPTDYCQWFYECEGCHTLLKPKPGDCCVYCSYGTVPCPPIQAGDACCAATDTSAAKGVVMKTLEIFDPAMCCASGVCGPSVDPDLARFAADLDWLKAHGVGVTRYNLAQEPQAFAQNAAVTRALQEGGPECLPLILVDGQLRSMAAYPSRQKLMQWVELKVAGDAKPHIKAGGCGCGPQGCA
jgi:hypothetical protein